MSKTFKLKNFPESSQEALCHPFLYLTVLEYYQNVSMIFSKMLTNEYIFLWMKWQLLSHLYYNYCYIILLLLKRNMNHGKSTIGLFNDFHLLIQIILYENISWCVLLMIIWLLFVKSTSNSYPHLITTHSPWDISGLYQKLNQF